MVLFFIFCPMGFVFILALIVTLAYAWGICRRGGKGAWVCYMDAVLDPHCLIEPTHWQPLPEPPPRCLLCQGTGDVVVSHGFISMRVECPQCKDDMFKAKLLTAALPIAYGGVLYRHGSDGIEILLREPTGHYGGYVWTFAKGRLDPGETPEEGALREVLEETGYPAKIIGKVSGSFKGDTSSTEYFLMEPMGTAGPLDEETSATRWVTPEEARELIAQTISKRGQERDLAVLAAALKDLGIDQTLEKE
jgi:8-oxo-dGTP diphosphatase